MMKRSLMFTLGCAVILLSGCYTARTYVVNKERVDQEIPGQPNNGPVKTRKMIVLEVVEKNKSDDTASAGQPKAGADAVAPAPEENNFTLPQSTVDAVKLPAATAVPQDYVVQKDDTLQKIAKKVYGSYSKWTKIYDANRDVIKDPNFLKEGVTLKVPVLEEQGTTVK